MNDSRSRLGDTTVESPGRGLRTVAATARIYSTLVTESAIVTALSPPRPRRRVGFEFEVIVDETTLVAPDVRSLVLRRTRGASMPSWLPGAHIDVITPSGRLRQYSLAGTPDGDRYRIGVRAVPGGAASTEIHRLTVGDTLRIRGPRNAFPMARSQDYLFVAAGIGITPILSMIEKATADRAWWTLYFHGRDRASLPFLPELEKLAVESGGRIIVRSDDIDGPPEVQNILGYVRDGCAVYVCGPAGLSAAIRSAMRQELPHNEFHTELFAPPPVLDGSAFRLEVRSTGETVEVGARETALDALRRIRPDQPYSCRQGFCGGCVVGYTSGEVDHRDRVLDPAARTDSLALCVSRGAPDTDLVLDL